MQHINIALGFLLFVSAAVSGQTSTNSSASTWDLVRQQMAKKAEPNKPVPSAKSVQPVKPAEATKPAELAKPLESAKSVEPAKTQQVEMPIGERILHFPKDHSIGQLYIDDENYVWKITAFYFEFEDWNFFAEAKGDVKVPAGKRLRLGIAGTNSRNLSALAQLQPDDLYSLVISSRSGISATDYPNHVMLDDKCLPYVARLTGLKGLELQFTSIDATGFSLLSNLKSLEYLSITSDNDYASKKLNDECLAEVSKLQTLKGLKIGDNNLTDKGLTYLSGLTSLKRLQIGGGRLTNAGLANLAKLPSLEYLSLYSHNFTDDGLVYLKDIPSLRTLDAGASHIWTDKALEHIAKIRNLEALSLYWPTGITDKGIAYLKNMSNLKKLNVGQATLTDKSMHDLKEIQTLEYLSLPSHGITDSGLQQITGLQNLKYLWVGCASNSPLTDESLRCVGQLKKLEELHIAGTGFSDEGMKNIATLKNLKRLDIFKADQLTNKGLAELSALPALTYLNLASGTQVSISGLKSLNNLKELKSLTLKNIHQDNISSMDISGLTELESLTLSLYTRRDAKNDSFRNSEDWACLANLKQLETLQISGEGIDDKGLKYLSGLKNLNFINIYCHDEPSITDAGIKQLADLPKLDRLMIKDGHFTDKALEYLNSMPSLNWLELTSDVAFSARAVRNFQAKNPNIEQLQLKP